MHISVGILEHWKCASVVFPGEIPWAEDADGLQSMRAQCPDMTSDQTTTSMLEIQILVHTWRKEGMIFLWFIYYRYRFLCVWLVATSWFILVDSCYLILAGRNPLCYNVRLSYCVVHCFLCTSSLFCLGGTSSVTFFIHCWPLSVWCSKVHPVGIIGLIS